MSVTTAAAVIREEVINNMSRREARELVAKVEEALENGHLIDDTLFTEYVGEVLAERGADVDVEGEGS